MADDTTPEQTTGEPAATLDKPVPAPDDPGGAHVKGYSADAGPEPALEDAPVPLAPGPQQHPAFHVPERDPGVQPTGRSEPKDYNPNDRLTGADR